MSRPARLGRLGLRDYLPGSAAGRVFAITSFIGAFGTGMYMAGATVFFVRVADLTRVQLGLGLGIAALFGLLATVPIGVLADRTGPKRTLVLLMVWRAACYAALAFTQGPVVFTVVACCQVAAQQASEPVTQAVVGAFASETDRTRIMAVIRTVRNAGFSIGALAATPLLLSDDPWLNRGILLGNAAAFVLSAALLARHRLPGAVVDAGRRPVTPLAALGAVRDWRYLCLAGVSGLLALHMTLLTVGVPLWVVANDAVADSMVPVVIFVNTVFAVIFQVPFARRATGSRGGVRALRLAGAALACCCLVLALPGATGATDADGAGDRAGALLATAALLAACVLLTCGELWQSAGGWELSYVYAPPHARGTYLSVFRLGVSAQEIAGPLLLAGVVVATGPAGWLGLAGLFMLLAAVAGAATAPLERRAAAGEPAAPTPVAAPAGSTTGTTTPTTDG